MTSIYLISSIYCRSKQLIKIFIFVQRFINDVIVDVFIFYFRRKINE